jgi:tetratricopeptide (TPR) repeat protein
MIRLIRIVCPKPRLALALLLGWAAACSSVSFGQGPAVGTEELLSAARNACGESRFRDAVELYTAAIKQADKQSPSYTERGAACEMINHPQRAIEDYKKAIETDPDNYAAMEKLAEMYERRPQDFAEALQLYRRALELDPRPESKENLRTNIAILENRLRPEDSSAVRCWHAGNRKMAAGDPYRAEVFYSKAIRLDPLMFQAYFSRGLIRARAGHPRHALKDFEETVRISPTLRGAYIQKGLANQQLGNSEQAGKDFEHAAKLDPRDPNALFHYAKFLEETREVAAALEYYDLAIERNPKSDLRKQIQDRISALGSVRKSDATKQSRQKDKNLW